MIDDTFAALKYRVTKYDTRVEYRNAAGQLHRDDGPAVIFNIGYKAWWVNGKRHRTDGPAIEYISGCEQQWYINGQHLTEEEFNERTK